MSNETTYYLGLGFFRRWLVFKGNHLHDFLVPIKTKMINQKFDLSFWFFFFWFKVKHLIIWENWLINATKQMINQVNLKKHGRLCILIFFFSDSVYNKNFMHCVLLFMIMMIYIRNDAKITKSSGLLYHQKTDERVLWIRN